MQQAIYLAPLRGLTDHIFRTAFERRFGRFDYMLAPFITTVRGRNVAPSHIKDVIGDENDRLRLIPQLLGNDPDDFLRLAVHLHAIGYRSINLNLGCPHPPQVTRKKRGCGLLPYPETVGRFLERVLPALPNPLSIKVRLGLDDGGELERLMPVLNRFPLSEVAVHPRTARQGYRGSVDLDRFETAAALCRHPVVYNGDIASIDDFRNLRRRFPRISRWMIGRGIVRNPFLLQSIRCGRDHHVDYALLRDFHDELFERNRAFLHGPAHLLGKMKGIWAYFSENFKGSRNVLRAIQRCDTMERYCRRVDEAFADQGAG
ncbi:MAG: tRNA-dihydrouridine synthase family protein [Chitinispirillaceae bacterium]|nr:tRNA-dihydrouridine synthase family protein [Chitinispirillaceae bacterium]